MSTTPLKQVSMNRSGFTLIEVIAVMVLLGMIAIVIAVSVNRSQADLSTTADRLSSHLRYTQVRALTDIVPWHLEITGGTQYRIGRVGGPWVRIPGGDTDTQTLPPGVTASSITVRFDNWGRPVNASNQALANNAVITLTDGSNSRTVTVTSGTGYVP